MTATHNPQPTIGAQDAKALSQRLAESYKKESELYGAILDLTQKQRENLEASEGVREFISLLQRKEGLIRTIDKLEMLLEDDKALWVSFPEDQKAVCSEELNRVLDGIIVLIEQIMQVERENEKLLSARKEAIESELSSVRAGCAAAKEYGSNAGAKVVSAVS